jgi:hypothetical protein
MRHRLPWWLLVIAGWVVTLVMVGVLLYMSIVFIMVAHDLGIPPEIGIGWSLVLLGGAAITLHIGVRTYSIARARRGGCALVIATSLPLVVLLLLRLVILIATGG